MTEERYETVNPFVGLFAEAYQNGFKQGASGASGNEPIPYDAFGADWDGRLAAEIEKYARAFALAELEKVTDRHSLEKAIARLKGKA